MIINLIAKCRGFMVYTLHNLDLQNEPFAHVTFLPIISLVRGCFGQSYCYNYVHGWDVAIYELI